MRALRYCFVVVLGLSTVAALAQALPAQIRIVVPLVAGSSLDARARVLAEALSKTLGSRVIVDNRPGAGGTLGSLQVARAKADGTTILFNNNSHVIAPHVYPSPGYDPLRDFVPIAQAHSTGMVILANPAVRASTVQELTALARRQPLTYGSSGTGSLPHLAMEMFRRSAGIELIHVPYRGDAQVLTDLLGGGLSLMVSGYPVAVPQVRAGTVRALAVTDDARSPVFPEVPTVSETYPGYVLEAWGGFFAPAGTSPALIQRLYDKIQEAIATPGVRAHYAATGADPVRRSPAEFRIFVQGEWARYGKLVRELRLQSE